MEEGGREGETRAWRWKEEGKERRGHGDGRRKGMRDEDVEEGKGEKREWRKEERGREGEKRAWRLRKGRRDEDMEMKEGGKERRGSGGDGRRITSSPYLISPHSIFHHFVHYFVLIFLPPREPVDPFPWPVSQEGTRGSWEGKVQGEWKGNLREKTNLSSFVRRNLGERNRNFRSPGKFEGKEEGRGGRDEYTDQGRSERGKPSDTLQKGWRDELGRTGTLKKGRKD
ncbi:hypothetical protein E2C01_040079 [Portunus trituberculatus]|uniref:Uncharacterized protein n=1 Tax=Portunus trituberculatus TaxID=210409 RepID=A0A5B7FFH4_PORTR|nr:hypothetical protein [Portunus trituberculatus]